jgi:SSS family solute:Na+ symporter
MTAAIIIYIVLLAGIGIYDSFKVKDFTDFAVAGKNQKFSRVFLSMMATMIGASATIGIVDTTAKLGFPAFWWLGVGSVGLICQALFLSEKIRALSADTLPDLAQKTVGTAGRTLLAAIIAVSWVGIIAAQFVSIAKIISVVMPNVDLKLLLTIIAAVVIVYTLFGGQLSVIKTDSIQTWVFAAGIIAVFIYLFAVKGGERAAAFADVELFNESFGAMSLINLLFITGGAYLLGPDIVSRNLVSKDGKTAKKAAVISAVVLAVFSAVIVLIGLWAVNTIPAEEMNGQNPLIYIMNNYVPYPLAILLCLALISTLLSSADTCLINAASIVEHDLLRRSKVNEIRIIVCVLGVAGLIIALFKTDIINLLMGAYTIYVPGVVCPLFLAIWFHKKRSLCKGVWYAAVIIGGGLGLLWSYFKIGFEYLPLIGMGISLVLGILSVLLGKKVEEIKQ